MDRTEGRCRVLFVSYGTSSVASRDLRPSSARAFHYGLTLDDMPCCFTMSGNSTDVRIADLLPAGSGVDAGEVHTEDGDGDAVMGDADAVNANVGVAAEAEAEPTRAVPAPPPTHAPAATSARWSVGDPCRCVYVADGQEVRGYCRQMQSGTSASDVQAPHSASTHVPF